jgi:hypothetical protein
VACGVRCHLAPHDGLRMVEKRRGVAVGPPRVATDGAAAAMWAMRATTATRVGAAASVRRGKGGGEVGDMAASGRAPPWRAPLRHVGLG